MTQPFQRSQAVLEFEKPLVDLELRVEALRASGDDGLAEALFELDSLRKDVFSRLTAWQRVQLARHPSRPAPLDYIEGLVPDFIELHGDRCGAEDPAIVGGLGTMAGRAVMIVAHARGRHEQEQSERLSGMPRPGGFRKAARLASLASRLGLPVVTFIDTPGAWPGADAEEHAQAMAIASCLDAFASVRSPVVACVVGEGGSGGALALALADVLLIQEFAVFAVISPEACSKILFRDVSRTEDMAAALKLTAQDLASYALVDEVVEEPPGGAHRDLAFAVRSMGEAIARQLERLSHLSADERAKARGERLGAYGTLTLEES